MTTAEVLAPPVPAWRSSKSPLSTTAGTDSRNEKRAAAARSKPSSRPALIVAPERDTPGISASACAKPIDEPVAGGHVVDVAVALGDRVGDREHDAEEDQHRPGQVEVARAVLDLVREREAEDADRDRRHDQVPAHAGVAVRAQLGVAQRPQPGARDVPQVLAEIEEDGRHRPELDDRGERAARVLPAGEGGDDQDVAAARDREELREPLHDPQHDRLEGRHGAPQSSDRACGASGRTRRGACARPRSPRPPPRAGTSRRP